MARMEMYSLRVSRDQKAAWDAYAEKLGVDTSLMVRTVIDASISMTPTQFQSFYPVRQTDEPDDPES